jgi:Elongation factor Tu domain 2
MAAAKKRKTKVVARKTAAKKPAVRKKSVAPKKAPAKRAAAKPAPPKPAAKAALPKPRPAPKPAAPARPEPLPGEERVGIVTHYFTHLSVAAILIESGSLRVGDTIRILGHTSDFRQRIDSMQIDRKPVTEAGRRQEIGLKVSQHAREHDDVYKVTG